MVQEKYIITKGEEESKTNKTIVMEFYKRSFWIKAIWELSNFGSFLHI